MNDQERAQVRQLAARFRERITDPRFGGAAEPRGETYALAMLHAAVLADQLAADLERMAGE